MKRFLIAVFALVLMVTTANAQKTIIKTESWSETQARMLEVTARSYVKPLVVDLVVAKGQTRKVFSKKYGRTEVDVAMGGSPDNLRSRVLYDASAEWNCDAVVAPTFKIELTGDGTGYQVEMKGFPANFDPNSWHPMNSTDYQWLEVDKMASSDKTKDPDRAGAVIRNVKK